MSKLAENSKLVTLLAFLAIYIIWGSTYLAIKYAIDTVPPLMMAGARFIVARTLSTYLCDCVEKRVRASSSGVKRRSLGPCCWLWVTAESFLRKKCSYRYVRSFGRDGSRIYCAARTYQQRSSQPENLYWITSWNGRDFYVGWPGAIMGNGGVSWFGVGALVLSSLSWSVGSVYARRAALPNSPIVSTALQMISGGLILSLVSFGLGESQKFDVSRISFSSVASFAYLVIFGSIVAFSAFSWLLKHQTASKVSTYAYVNPIVAVFLGWALLGEKVSIQIVYSGAIILVAVWLITAPAKKLVLEPISVESNDGLKQRLMREVVASNLDR